MCAFYGSIASEYYTLYDVIDCLFSFCFTECALVMFLPAPGLAKRAHNTGHSTTLKPA
jgi:hypothetical protein